MGSEPDPAAEAELRQRMLDELARTQVNDVLLQTVFTLSTLAGARLGLDEETRPLRDLAEAKKAIDVLSALVPTLGSSVAAAELGQLRQMLAGLQLAYAESVRAASAGEAPEPEPQTPTAPPPPPGEERPRIWTPRGEV